SAQHNAARRGRARNDFAEHAAGRNGKHSRCARGRSRKRNAATGDRQRISVGRSCPGASSGDGAWRVGKNRSDTAKRKAEGLIRKPGTRESGYRKPQIGGSAVVFSKARQLKAALTSPNVPSRSRSPFRNLSRYSW